MYESFYGFKEHPFTLLPDPDFLFLDEEHRTALNVLETAVSARSGFCVISGEIGAGKTTLICELLNRLDDTVCVGLVSNTHPSFGELLQWILSAYGLPLGDNDELDMHKRFVEFVSQQHAQKKHTLLIIDEAQNLSSQALEELRMLSNVNSERNLVLQIILVGQQQLRDTLHLPELAQFSQRVTLNFHLRALNQDATYRYIQHRITHAGGESGLFSADACQVIYNLSGGIPRIINRLCDLSLIYGRKQESKTITRDLVDKVGVDQRTGNVLGVPRAIVEVVEVEEAVFDEVVPVVDVPVVDVPVVDVPVVDVPVQVKVEAKVIPAPPPELHQLVADAVPVKNARCKVMNTGLLLAIVVITGGAGWMISDLKSVDSGLLSSDSSQPFVSAVIAKPARSLQGELGGQSLSIIRRSDPVPVAGATAEDTEQEHTSASGSVEHQGVDEMGLAAEKTAMLKRESERMEREQRSAEERLAALRASRKELERKAVAERKKMTEAKKVAKRLAAEKSKANTSAQRKKKAAAKDAARKIAKERARAKALVIFGEVGVSAYDEDDSDAIVLDAKANFSANSAEFAAQEGSLDAYAEDDGDAVIRDARGNLAQ